MMLFMAASLVAFVSGCGLCSYQTVAEQPSPDGMTLAQVEMRDCGATTDYATVVILSGQDWWSRLKWRLFPRGGDEVVLAAEGRDADVSLEWLDSGTLKVRTRVIPVRYEPRWREVAVKYEISGDLGDGVSTRALGQRDAELLPAAIALARSGGNWCDGERRGIYRAVVWAGGFEEVYHHVYVQLLEIDDASRTVSVWRTIPVEETMDLALIVSDLRVGADDGNPCGGVVIVGTAHRRTDRGLRPETFRIEVTQRGAYSARFGAHLPEE